MKPIQPKKYSKTLIDVPSAWKGLENYIESIIEECGITPNSALEVGVDNGYSTHILSELFKEVVAVDDFRVGFIGRQTKEQADAQFANVYSTLKDRNIQLVREDFNTYKDKISDKRFDLIHIDADHSFEATLEQLTWALEHSNLVIAHDTISFPTVMQACEKVIGNGVEFYNIPNHHGLGVLFRPPVAVEAPVEKVEPAVEEVKDEEPKPKAPRKKRVSKKNTQKLDEA